MHLPTPSLWFDKNAEEAINYYVETFNNAPGSPQKSKINSLTKYPTNIPDEHMQGMEGKIINGEFELNGQKFIALDGGPLFKFNESVSFTIMCESQEEVDYFWEKLSAVPESEQCGWVKDKFGLSWQIIPTRLNELMSDSDPEKVKKVTMAMLKMKKLVVKELEMAYNS